MKNLKNYTSEVPASRSIGRIEELLISIGAKNINKQYEDGIIKSFIFLIDLNGTTLSFKLPAKVSIVEKVLWKEIKRPNAGTKERIQKQAERTAWKIVHDWVEIQCSMILLEQAEIAQIFLPYHYDPSTNKTLWERVKDNDIKLLTS